MSRIYEYRRKAWEGKTIKEIQETDPYAPTYAMIMLYAKRHDINIASALKRKLEIRRKTWAGRMAHEIAEEEGICPSTVYYYANDHNIPLMSRGDFNDCNLD